MMTSLEEGTMRFQPMLLLHRTLPAFGPVARLDFVPANRLQQTAEFVVEGRQFTRFPRVGHLGEVQKRSNQDALTMLKVGTDVNFSQSEIFQ
jgi:hypothetical protein